MSSSSGAPVGVPACTAVAAPATAAAARISPAANRCRGREGARARAAARCRSRSRRQHREAEGEPARGPARRRAATATVTTAHAQPRRRGSRVGGFACVHLVRLGRPAAVDLHRLASRAALSRKWRISARGGVPSTARAGGRCSSTAPRRGPPRPRRPWQDQGHGPRPRWAAPACRPGGPCGGRRPAAAAELALPASCGGCGRDGVGGASAAPPARAGPRSRAARARWRRLPARRGCRRSGRPRRTTGRCGSRSWRTRTRVAATCAACWRPCLTAALDQVARSDPEVRAVLAAGNEPLLVVPMPSAGAAVRRRGDAPLRLLVDAALAARRARGAGVGLARAGAASAGGRPGGAGLCPARGQPRARHAGRPAVAAGGGGALLPGGGRRAHDRRHPGGGHPRPEGRRRPARQRRRGRRDAARHPARRPARPRARHRRNGHRATNRSPLKCRNPHVD